MVILNKLDKEKFLFYLLLCILITNRLIATCQLDAVPEDQVFFNAVSISRGIPPLPSFFQQNRFVAGAGLFIFSIVSVPFVWLCGESYFSLKVTNFFIHIIMYILLWKFCLRYFTLCIALFAVLLFNFIPGFLTQYAVLSIGRYFELNIFFITSLFLLCKSVESKKMVYYLFLGIVCGSGVYFYPGFLFTASVIFLFLWATVKHKWTMFGFAHVWFIMCIMTAMEYLESGISWHHWHAMINQLFCDTRLFVFVKEMTLFESFLHIGTRLGVIIVNLPTMFTPEAEFGYIGTRSFTGISRIIFSIPFYFSFTALMWINRRYLQRAIVSICSLRKKYTPTPHECAVSFLILHFILYLIFFSMSDQQVPPWKYHIIIIFNVILLIALCINKVWTVHKRWALSLFICALFPGIIFHGFLYIKGTMDNFYKQYICFYQDEQVYDITCCISDVSIKKEMCELFPPFFSYTLGKTFLSEPPEDIEKHFDSLTHKNKAKLAKLYQGYMMHYYHESNGDIRQSISIIEMMDTHHWESCYQGLGEGITTFEDLHHEPPGYWFCNLEAMKDSIEGKIVLIPENCKKYFYQGLGIGIAKQFAVPCSKYITEYGFYDNDILNQHIASIDKKYRKDFMKGFSIGISNYWSNI